MKRIMILMSGFVLAIGITACGSSNDNGGEGSSNGGDEVDASAAQDVFKENCASCHGENLEGKNGPELDHIGKEMSKDDIKKQIKDGGGGMPAEIIKGDEADNVAGWLADKK